MSELRKCYFCGANAPEIKLNEKKVLDGGNLEGDWGIFSMTCENCGAKAEHDIETDLIRMWNYVER